MAHLGPDVYQPDGRAASVYDEGYVIYRELHDAFGEPAHVPGRGTLHDTMKALLDVRDRTLYCGDAYSTLGGVATTAKPNPRFPLPALASWHRPTALETARALRALEPSRLAPGHGKVVSAPAERMDAAIARAAG